MTRTYKKHKSCSCAGSHDDAVRGGRQVCGGARGALPNPQRPIGCPAGRPPPCPTAASGWPTRRWSEGTRARAQPHTSSSANDLCGGPTSDQTSRLASRDRLARLVFVVRDSGIWGLCTGDAMSAAGRAPPAIQTPTRRSTYSNSCIQLRSKACSPVGRLKCVQEAIQIHRMMFSSACKLQVDIYKEFRQPGRHGVSMTTVLLRLGDTDMMPCVH